MTTEQFGKLNELARRLYDSDTASVKCEVELTDDYFKVTELNPSEGFVTITHSNGNFMEEFPITSLSETIIDNILYDAECVLDKEEAELDKVFDRIEWGRGL